MKNFKYLLSTVALGFLLSALSGCSGNGNNVNPSSCNASNCSDGCCDSAGTCVKPAQQSASTCGTGTGGEACKACTVGQTCAANVCGSGACNPSNCPGCCNGDTCVAASQQATLGKCGSNGDVCTASACGGNNGGCAGCFNGNGVCVQGTSDTSCGKGGNTCAVCSGTEECVNGECKTPAVVCDDETCPTGCCAADGTCKAGTEKTACGSFGATCRSCPGAQICTEAQRCQEDISVVTSDVGKACAADEECGAGFTCRKHTGKPGVDAGVPTYPYPDGFCTKVCDPSSASACPAGSECQSFTIEGAPLFGENETICIPKCNDTKPCRGEPQYACMYTASTATSGYCVVNPPSTKIGAACTDPLDCLVPPAPGQGGCVPATDPRGEPTGFADGYCSATCTFVAGGDYNCGASAICIPVTAGSDEGACVAKCTGTGQGTCRTGYLCKGATAGNPGVCLP